jgi:hypothetical protein
VAIEVSRNSDPGLFGYGRVIRSRADHQHLANFVGLAADSTFEPLGDVESVNIGSEDVGEAYADMEVRLANGRRLEQRLLELLATRTGSLEDVLAVERELARVRQEIESPALRIQR